MFLSVLMDNCCEHKWFSWLLIKVPKVVVICELYDKGNNFTSADHSDHRV